MKILALIISVTYVYCCPPQKGGEVPKKYLNIFKNKSAHYNDNYVLSNELKRSGSSTSSQMPPSNYNLAVIMVEYSDKSFDFSKDDFQEHLFGVNPSGSLSDYYSEVSYGNFNLSGTVYGPYQSNYSENEATEELSSQNNSSGFITSVFSEADTDINFSNFENDLGYVHAVMIIFPGAGADESHDDSDLYPHYATLLDSENPGYTYASFNLHDDTTIRQYMVCPEKRMKQGVEVNEMRPIGVYAHELGHALGLPDLYDTTPQEDQDSEGVGEWCLMGSGSWLGNDGDTPSHLSAWAKYKLGWIDPIELSYGIHDLNIESVETTGVTYKIYANSYRWNEYFLLENRQRDVLVNYDEYPVNQQGPADNGTGLIIYHVDENQFWGTGRLFGLGLNNDDETHKLVDIEEADGDNDLDKNNNRGDAGDPYPGASGNTSFNNTSNPNNYHYKGLSSSVSITNIVEENGVISLNADVPYRDGHVLSYDNGFNYIQGYSLDDYEYAVKFIAEEDTYLSAVDIALFNDINNLDITVYRSMTNGFFNDNPQNIIFETTSYDSLGKGWNTIDLGSISVDAGNAFYINILNKNTDRGLPHDEQFEAEINNSYVRNYQNNNNLYFSTSNYPSLGNLCVRARFDNDGTLKNEHYMPAEFEIGLGYPNPFNPTISLPFSISKPENVSISIFDINGQLVENIANDFYNSGTYYATWDAVNKASGIYFAKYKAGDESFSQKITLLK